MIAANPRSPILLLGAVLLLWLCACDEDKLDDEAADQAHLEALRVGIETLVGEAPCGDVDDCRFIAFGSKPCGGPWSYLIYSVSGIDTVALATRVSEYNRFEDDMNKRYGYASDCSVPTPPTLGCRDGFCADIGIGK